MRSLALISLLVLCAGTATALSPPPECYYDRAAGRLVTPEAARSDTPAVFFQVTGETFVSWDVIREPHVPGVPERLVLQHCPTGQELLVVLPELGGRAIAARYDEMVFGAGRYTMRRIGEALAEMGAGVRRTTAEFGTCACDVIGGTS